MRAQIMVLYNQLQVTTVQEEQYTTKEGTMGNAPHAMVLGEEEEELTRTCMLKPT